MPKTILIATTNPGKIYEYKYVLKKMRTLVDFIFLDEIEKEIPAPDETGATYEDNALIKAEYYFKHLNMPVISDDSGIEISALGNIPGVHTARFLNEHGDNTFQKLESLIQEKDPKRTNQKATFHCCAIYKDQHTTILENALVEGLFTFPPKGNLSNTFGYDPIFKLQNLNLTLAEIDIETKIRYCPRGSVIKQILDKLGY